MSTETQEDSPATQGQHTAEFIQAHQLPTWTRTYYDLGITGSTVDKRPGIMQLLRDAEVHKPAAIVFYKLDRAFRNSYEQTAALRHLKKLRIKVLKVRDPNIEGPQGELIDSVLGAVNQFERELTGIRIRDHNQAMAQRGEWPGGAPPFGYRYIKAKREQVGRKRVTVEPGRLEPDPIEAPVARQIWDWALQGYRKSEIVDMANAAGYLRRSGLPWSMEAITQLLINKTYAGYVPFARHIRMHGRMKRQPDRAEWYPGQHQALITLEEYLRVQATTNSRMGQRQAHSRARTELAGLYRCLLCGAPVIGNSYTADGGYHYTCQGAVKRNSDHGLWSRRDWVIHMALPVILDRATESLPDEIPRAESDERREFIAREIERLKQRKRRMRTLFELGEYDDDLEEYKRKSRDLETQIAAKEAELASAGPGQEELAQRWELLRNWEEAYEAAEGDIRERQRFWASLIEEVKSDAHHLVVRLRDFGPAVTREWEIDLPPLRTRRPGTRVGKGIVGQRKSGRTRSKVLNLQLQPRPVEPAEKQ